MNRRSILISGVASGVSWLAAPGAVRAGSLPRVLAQAGPGQVDPEIRIQLAAFYRARQDRPAWSGGNRRTAVQALSHGPSHGLIVPDPTALTERELTVAILSLAMALAIGRVDPTSVEALWEMDRNTAVDLGQGLARAVDTGTVSAFLDGLAPSDRGYVALRDGYQRYRALAESGGWPAFETGPTIEPFAADRRVPRLLPRLIVEGDLTPAGSRAVDPENLVYGSQLQEAVRAFQAFSAGMSGASSSAPMRASDQRLSAHWGFRRRIAHVRSPSIWSVGAG